MKLKNYVVAFSTICIAAGFSSCKKNSSDNADELKTTVELSGDQAVSDNLNSDAENVLNEAAVEYDFSGSRTTNATQSMNVLSCAAVTVNSGFPKNISIDFGAGCESGFGVIRSGKITVTLSDSLRKPGSIAFMTFDNYYVSGFKKEGTIKWTNTSQVGTKSWRRECENGKITAPGGRYWIHAGVQNVAQSEGSNTPWNLLDDTFLITGTATVTNSSGASRTAEITTALQKKVICGNIDKGVIKIQGPSHYAVIDYGDGTCNSTATISIDGSNPLTFVLR